MRRYRVLVFPFGTEIANEVVQALADNKTFERSIFNNKNPFGYTDEQMKLPFIGFGLGYSLQAGTPLPRLALSRVAVLVGPDTQRLTAPLFDYEALAPLQVKGREQPVAVYRLLGPKAQPGTTRGIEGLRSPLVGRDTELQQLQRAFAGLAGGRGGILAVIGEAGQGKSRLVAEARQVFGRAVLGARCSVLGPATTNRPLWSEPSTEHRAPSPVW